jgi:hypothetical protein
MARKSAQNDISRLNCQLYIRRLIVSFQFHLNYGCFLWQVTCGDMTNGEKEDVTQTKVSTKIKNFLNLEISENFEPSMSLRLAMAFVAWISSVLPSE